MTRRERIYISNLPVGVLARKYKLSVATIIRYQNVKKHREPHIGKWEKIYIEMKSGESIVLSHKDARNFRSAINRKYGSYTMRVNREDEDSYRIFCTG